MHHIIHSQSTGELQAAIVSALHDGSTQEPTKREGFEGRREVNAKDWVDPPNGSTRLTGRVACICRPHERLWGPHSAASCHPAAFREIGASARKPARPPPLPPLLPILCDEAPSSFVAACICQRTCMIYAAVEPTCVRGQRSRCRVDPSLGPAVTLACPERTPGLHALARLPRRTRARRCDRGTAAGKYVALQWPILQQAASLAATRQKKSAANCEATAASPALNAGRLIEETTAAVTSVRGTIKSHPSFSCCS
mmetsp:Transcript_26370/g.78296  ORF Transcript_26370/g.78296 Transcript_26370/m.78296 type:complete len:254 (-) Transcript_26370:2360-3121(-)